MFLFVVSIQRISTIIYYRYFILPFMIWRDFNIMSDKKNEVIKIANALKFDPNVDTAPQLIAKGVGLVADNIIKKAKENNVPIYVDNKLSNQLKQLEIGDQIPFELYEVVAEVLIFIGGVDQTQKK